MSKESPDLNNGATKAAILLLTLGEQAASQVLKHMEPREVQAVGSAMASLKSISKDQVSEVLADFCRVMDKQTGLGLGAHDYIRKVLVQALGEEKAGNMMERILRGANTKGLETLKWMDSRSVAEIIHLEHPQIIAAVLSHLDADQAAEVLTYFPERGRADVIMRIATIDGIQPVALAELSEIMEKQFSANANVKSSPVGGAKTAADILNSIDSSLEAQIMDNIKEVDADLGQRIQDLMFAFDNLNDVSDRDIQTILREITSDLLIVALKGADEPLKEKIFKNMSKRASEMLRDDLLAKGPVRLSDVETAQKEILAVARRLAESGDISLGGSGADEYI